MEKESEDIVKIGPVELYKEEALRIYENGLYIVTYSTIYKPEYDFDKKKVYGTPIYYSPGLMKRGRFQPLSALDVNKLVGFPLIK